MLAGYSIRRDLLAGEFQGPALGRLNGPDGHARRYGLPSPYRAAARRGTVSRSCCGYWHRRPYRLLGRDRAIVGQFTVEAETPDEAIAWLKAELAAKLQPGEAGSPWQPYGQGEPGYVLGSVRELRGDPGVPARRRE